MPVNELIRGNDCIIKCWEINESTSQLEDMCKFLNIQYTNTYTLEARYQQYLVTQLLFADLFPGENLSYESTGKPVTDSASFVSISHSGNKVVMMKSGLECGVDIERIHSRIKKVEHKFLNDEELVRVSNSPVEELTRYWTAKEAMFKVYGSQEVFMRNNIFVNNLSNDTAQAILQDGELKIYRTIRFHIFDDMMLAWTESDGK